MMIDQAIHLASEVHLGQTDKAEEPYIEHVLAVKHIAGKIYKDDFMREELLAAAVLHDTIEDCGYTNAGKALLKAKIDFLCGPDVLKVVEVLTKVKGENYLESYIPRVSGHWMSRIIKIADLTHNMDPSRLPRGEIKDYDFKRWDKYRRALVALEETA